MKKKKGFTLVELLAVIVILSVLVLLAVRFIKNDEWIKRQCIQDRSRKYYWRW